jgi:hypothetical protein
MSGLKQLLFIMQQLVRLPYAVLLFVHL